MSLDVFERFSGIVQTIDGPAGAGEMTPEGFVYRGIGVHEEQAVQSG
jgi:hypothetical protein